MPTCTLCGDEAEELVTMKIDGRKKRVCEECAEEAAQEAELAEESEAVVQQMMGFKGRR